MPRDQKKKQKDVEKLQYESTYSPHTMDTRKSKYCNGLNRSVRRGTDLVRQQLQIHHDRNMTANL